MTTVYALLRGGHDNYIVGVFSAEADAEAVRALLETNDDPGEIEGYELDAARRLLAAPHWYSVTIRLEHSPSGAHVFVPYSRVLEEAPESPSLRLWLGSYNDGEFEGEFLADSHEEARARAIRVRTDMLAKGETRREWTPDAGRNLLTPAEKSTTM